MRRLTQYAAACLAAVAAIGGPIAASAVAAPPDRIDLPTGYQPEGIARLGGFLIVGSIPTGEIRRLDPRDGSQEVLVPGRPGEAAAIGLKTDGRRIFVAGGPTGKAFVYKAQGGKELAAIDLNTSGDTFINDVAIFGSFAYFTDSRAQVIYEVRRDLSGVREIQVPGIPLTGGFDLNGIVATRDGKYLIAVAAGTLYRIDRFTGDAIAIDVDPDATANGDGLLLRGNELFVVQNFRNQVSQILLTPFFERGTVLGTLTSPEFAIPTTIARKGDAFFLPNARFDAADPATTDYWVTRIPVP